MYLSVFYIVIILMSIFLKSTSVHVDRVSAKEYLQRETNENKSPRVMTLEEEA